MAVLIRVTGFLLRQTPKALVGLKRNGWFQLRLAVDLRFRFAEQDFGNSQVVAVLILFVSLKLADELFGTVKRLAGVFEMAELMMSKRKHGQIHRAGKIAR